ncbi:MAG TPA: hypothetical protein VMW49_04440 [Candidatus Dormibacteraeota bacterium]|nr:hypothetical protein [Candidatus Dormibacteraeota bacterium]
MVPTVLAHLPLVVLATTPTVSPCTTDPAGCIQSSLIQPFLKILAFLIPIGIFWHIAKKLFAGQSESHLMLAIEAIGGFIAFVILFQLMGGGL